VKESIKTIWMRTGAPKYVRLTMAKCLADIHSITVDETLDWQIPLAKRKGETPDTSAFLQFKYYKTIYFLDIQMKFPTTKERPGYWLGVAHNIGDALTYIILTVDTRQTIEGCVIQSAEDPKTKNKDVTFDPELEPVFTENDDNENVQMEGTKTEPHHSSPRLTT
jgi:hypothetical protein